MIVSDEAFAYLSIQRGRISNFRHDRKAWLAAYEASLAADLETLAPWLPERCGALLDVGSGLGGIDILLARRYGPETVVRLIDGHDDEPQVEFHRRTFSSMDAALGFFAANGAGRPDYIPAAEVRFLTPAPTADLVISLGAWCFHFPPEEYLDFVAGSCAPAAVVILDVRNGKPEWSKALNERFTFIGVAREAEKFTRMVFRV